MTQKPYFWESIEKNQEKGVKETCAPCPRQRCSQQTRSERQTPTRRCANGAHMSKGLLGRGPAPGAARPWRGCDME